MWREIICFEHLKRKNCLHPLELVPSDKAIAVSINPSESSLFIKIGWGKISASSTIIITITKVLHYSHSHPYHLHPVQLSRRALSAGSSSTAQRPSTDPLLPNLTAYIENLTFRGNLCFLHLRPPRPPPLLFGVACSLRSLLTYSVSFKVIFFCEFRWGSIVIYIVDGHGCPKRKGEELKVKLPMTVYFLWGERNGLSNFFLHLSTFLKLGVVRSSSLELFARLMNASTPTCFSY